VARPVEAPPPCPATNPDPRETVVRRPRIDLTGAPSGMESAAARWVRDTPARPIGLPARESDGRRWCEQCDALVDERFAAGCISAFCSLKKGAR
jgi:hypothetical protein